MSPGVWATQVERDEVVFLVWLDEPERDGPKFADEVRMNFSEVFIVRVTERRLSLGDLYCAPASMKNGQNVRTVSQRN